MNIKQKGIYEQHTIGNLFHNTYFPFCLRSFVIHLYSYLKQSCRLKVFQIYHTAFETVYTQNSIYLAYMGWKRLTFYSSRVLISVCHTKQTSKPHIKVMLFGISDKTD